jgi:hypothetical protein
VQGLQALADTNHAKSRKMGVDFMHLPFLQVYAWPNHPVSSDLRILTRKLKMVSLWTCQGERVSLVSSWLARSLEAASTVGDAS